MEDDPRLTATEPYDVAAQQAEFAGQSPRSAYAAICQGFRLKPRLSVADMLPDTVGAWAAVTNFDFSRTYVGAQGLRTIIKLCRCLPQLYSLVLRDNYVTNEMVWYLVQMALFHPSLARIDLSANEFISWSGAMCMVELVLRNPRITYAELRGTAVSAEIRDAIAAQAHQNAVGRFRCDGRKMQPPVHPAAVYIRALQHLFSTHQANGYVSAALLENGLEEILRVSGRTGQIRLSKDKCLVKLKTCAPPEGLTFEAFLILLLIEGSTYDEGLVAKLKQIFVMFNMNLSAPDAAETEGYVMARDLGDMLAHMYGLIPAKGDVEAMQRRLGATEDTTRLEWAEFLYVAYPRGPQAGSRLSGTTCTPLPSPIEVMHY